MIKPLFILFNAVANFFSKKFFSVYLEIKKQTDAPKEEAKAIKNNASKNEKIAIFGDYDVDGATSTAILGNYFNELNLDYEIYIPDRKKEGYGPSIESFKKLINKKVKIIFTFHVDLSKNWLK